MLLSTDERTNKGRVRNSKRSSSLRIPTRKAGRYSRSNTITPEADLIVVLFVGGITTEKDSFGDRVEIVSVGNPSNEVDNRREDGATVKTTRISLQQMMVES